MKELRTARPALSALNDLEGQSRKRGLKGSARQRWRKGGSTFAKVKVFAREE